METYDAVIIGAGNGGLTAGATLAKEGFKVLLLEKHNIPGGCGTSFCRGRFEFEIALHQLSGLGSAQKPGPLRAVLDSIQVLDSLNFIEMKDLYRLIVKDQLDITLRPDRSAVISELQKQFPGEKNAIDQFFELVYKFFSEVIAVFYFKVPDVTVDKYPLYFEYALKNTNEVLDEYFKDPLLKLAVAAYWPYLGLPPRYMPFRDLAALLFVYIEFKPYHVQGGSQAISNAIADKIIANGGEIRYNCAAKKILIKNNRVVGVMTEHGDEIQSKYVISNASMNSTFVDLIDQENVPEEAKQHLRGTSLSASAITLYMGLDCEAETVGLTESTNFVCDTSDFDEGWEQFKNLQIDKDLMLITSFNAIDPGYSPPGTSQVALVTLKYGEPWLKIAPHDYVKYKYECAENLLNRAEKIFPGMSNHIEEIEISTPITHMRYLGHPMGAIYGNDGYRKNSELITNERNFVKGLYHTGASVGMGGFQPTLESGASTARAVIKDLTSQEGRS